MIFRKTQLESMASVVEKHPLFDRSLQAENNKKVFRQKRLKSIPIFSSSEFPPDFEIQHLIKNIVEDKFKELYD